MVTAKHNNQQLHITTTTYDLTRGAQNFTSPSNLKWRCANIRYYRIIASGK